MYRRRGNANNNAQAQPVEMTQEQLNKYAGAFMKTLIDNNVKIVDDIASRPNTKGGNGKQAKQYKRQKKVPSQVNLKPEENPCEALEEVPPQPENKQVLPETKPEVEAPKPQPKVEAPQQLPKLIVEKPKPKPKPQKKVTPEHNSTVTIQGVPFESLMQEAGGHDFVYMTIKVPLYRHKEKGLQNSLFKKAAFCNFVKASEVKSVPELVVVDDVVEDEMDKEVQEVQDEVIEDEWFPEAPLPNSQ